MFLGVQFWQVNANVMNKKILKEQVINDCDECRYYKYFSCHGCDCDHPEAPDEKERGEEEPLAENRDNNFPKWCPLENCFITTHST